MALDSQPYFLFLIAVCAIYYCLKPRWRWTVILGASYFFYWTFSPASLPLIVLSTLAVYLLSHRIAASETVRSRKLWLICGLICALAPLLLYKILLAQGQEAKSPWFVPLGVSFYTLQIIGYLVDVYHATLPPEKNLGRVALLVCFFPQLMAGPIEMASKLLPQFKMDVAFDRARIKMGAYLIFAGLFKKLVIADALAVVLDEVYGNLRSYHGLALIAATIFGRYHIYCDFSGYTDIALGSAALFGIALTQNFHRPFYADSIADFWRRWHISLSSWMKNYVYFPLITGPTARLGLYFCVILTFTLLGLWHGLSWNFLMFGILQGGLIAAHDASSQWREKFALRTGLTRVPRFHLAIRILITFVFFICLPTVLFRTTNLADAWYVYSHYFNPPETNKYRGWLDLSFVSKVGARIYVTLFFILLLEIAHVLQTRLSITDWLSAQPRWMRWSLYAIGLILIAVFGTLDERTNFIYNRL